MPHVELPQTEFKVVVLGDTNVGKTSLVLRFTEGYYREKSRSPTVGAFFLTKRMQTSSGVTAKVQIWDTAGQKQFRKMAPIYWRNSAAIILCYDMGNIQSWNVAVEWLKDLRCDSNVLEKNIVLALVATKSDLYEEEYCSSFHPQEMRENGGGSPATGGYVNQRTLVPMAQVEQVLQSMNHNNLTSFVPDSGMNSSNSAAASSVMNAATPTNQQGNNSGEGQILHILTSARTDDNVDALFQKVAEEVLYVQEQEKNLWMNYGIKYKHYSTTTSNINTSIMNTTHGENGVGDLDFLNRNNMTNGNGNFVDNNTSSPNGISSNTLMGGNQTSIDNDGRQSQLSPQYEQSKHFSQHQFENATRGVNIGAGTYYENKENRYQTSPSRVRGDDATTRSVHNDKYRMNHQESKNEILEFSRPKEIPENADSVSGSVGNGLCYSGVCGSTSVVVDQQESSCIIS